MNNMNVSRVQDYLYNSAALYPNKLAITDGSRSISFKELADDSDKLAGLLSDLGVTRQDRVIYYLKRRPECLTATMGILKSGGIYIPLDSSTPSERLTQIVLDAKPKVVLCDHSTLKTAIELKSTISIHNLQLVSIDERRTQEDIEGLYYLEDLLSSRQEPVTVDGKPDDVAYILYTSGSTGSPKGVMITHKNIRNYIDWAVSYFKITNDDRILGTAPVYFDMSTFDLFCSISAGVSLYLATGSKLLFPVHLSNFIEENRITIWKGVSSLLMYMCRAEVVKHGRMGTLKTIIFAGEPLASQYLAEWMNAFPQVSFYNGYGPTEATGVSLCHHVREVPQPGQKIPIGIPCKGAKVVVLGDNDMPVSPGEIGELYISGECLAKGYLNDQEKTNRHFISPPPGLDMGARMYRTGDLVQENSDGEYVFISRKDHQVKWMGYRIELGEIETKLLAHQAIDDVAVLLIEDDATNLSQLIAFYESSEDLESKELARYLNKFLPKYMIPKIFIYMEKLPRNDRGKISRKEILEWYQKVEKTTSADLKAS